MAKDPICGMTVDPNNAAGKHDYEGRKYHFCSQHCADRFKENPAKYVEASEPAQAAAVEHSRPAKTTVTDPVCGMTIESARAAGKQQYNGQLYYFCSRRCLIKFTLDPAGVLSVPPGERTGADPEVKKVPEAKTATVEHESAVSAQSPGATYVCPMDPEVRESKPGACPKCGMALEPAVPVTPTKRTQWTLPDASGDRSR